MKYSHLYMLLITVLFLVCIVFLTIYIDISNGNQAASFTKQEYKVNGYGHGFIDFCNTSVNSDRPSCTEFIKTYNYNKIK